MLITPTRVEPSTNSTCSLPHIILQLWKLKEGVSLQTAKASIDALSKLKAPGRLSCQITPTVGPSDRIQGFELGMYSTFESMDALNTYATSKEHVE